MVLHSQCHFKRIQEVPKVPDLPSITKKAFVNAQNDTILTGVPFPVSGYHVDRSEIRAPVLSRLNPNPSRVSTLDNFSFLSGDRKTRITEVSAPVVMGEEGIPIPTSRPVRGHIIPVHHTPMVKAGLPEMSDFAITDLRCLDMDHGMKSSLVITTLQDSRGHLWIATDGGGVSRYDGTHFLHFTTEEGLPDNEVNALVEDSHGHIWMATGSGIIRYNGVQFSHLSTRNGLNHDRIMKMILSKDGDIWFGSRGGLARLRLNEPYNHSTIEGTLTQYTEENGLAQAGIRALMEDKQGNVWIGMQNRGLHRFTPNANDMGGSMIYISSKNGLPDDMVRAILEDPGGKIWVGTFHLGIHIFDPDKLRDNASFTHINTMEGLSHRSVRSFFSDSHDNIWVGTGGGVNKIVSHPDGRQSITFYDTDEGLTHTNVYDVYEDGQGNIWLGTHDGLCILDPSQDGHGGGSQFIHYSRKEGLLSDKVVSMTEDREGNMWFGTMGGLHKYDGSSISRFNIEDGLSSRSVRAMMEDDEGVLWFGTERGGLNRYDPQINRNAQYWTEQGLTDIHITCMLQDSRGSYWFGTLQDGVNAFVADQKGDGGEFYHYTINEGLTDNDIRFVMEDDEGHIWIGTMGGGATRFTSDENPSAGEFMHFTTNEGLSHDEVNCMMQDSRGFIWFGTWGGGVTILDPKTEALTYITSKDGLSSNIIWTMIEDDEGRFWLATESGITLMVPDNPGSSSPDQFRYYTFAKADGLKKIVFEGNSVSLNSKNQIWWGGGFNGGLSRLDLNHFKLPTSVPSVQLQHIEVNQRFVDFANVDEASESAIPFVKVLQKSIGPIESFYNYPLELNLPYALNHLTFHFTSTDWSAPHKIMYSFMMDGLENEWSPPAFSNSVDYRNLPYGKFVLRARAIGHSQEWSEEFAYAFSIKPPWWHTWWIRVIYGLIGISVIYLLIHWRLEKLRKERNSQREFSEALIFAQEEERRRIARDLHDGIGQSLLLIKKNIDSAKASIADNRNLVTNTLEEVRSISQNLHPFKLEKFGLTTAIEDVVNQMTHSTDLFVSKEIENIDGLLNPKAEINVFRTVQEAINNVIKHSGATATKISIATSNTEILITIQDNGKGFDFEEALTGTKSLGLKTMSERISSIGGKLSFDHISPQGTLVDIRIPNGV